MKKITGFRFLIIALIALSAPLLLMNCSSSKSTSGSLSKKDLDWYNSKVWLDGLQLTPHESINKEEFVRQYKKNKTYYDEAFNYLKTHNVAEMAPGTYQIDSNNVYMMIVESDPNEKDKVKWEAHKNFNDIQMILKGKAKMGVGKVASPDAVVVTSYDPKADIAFYNINGEKYYDGVPGTFYIFSPQEMHQPAFKIPGNDWVKKMVIKVRVPK